MSVDTIYSIDTVYIQNKFDSISQSEMLEQIGTMHTMYDDNFSNLLIVVTILGGVIGFILPLIMLSFQNYQYNKFDKKIRKELKTEILEDLNNKFTEKTKEFEKISLNHIRVSNMFKQVNNEIDNDNYLGVLVNLLYVSKESFETNTLYMLNDIVYLLERHEKKFFEINQDQLEVLKEYDGLKLRELAKDLYENNTEKIDIIRRFYNALDRIFRDVDKNRDNKKNKGEWIKPTDDKSPE